jgi:hypothetical protein
MAVKWESVKAGDVLFDYHSTRAGNTTARRWSNWEVRIVSIDHAAGKAEVRWNGNPTQTWHKDRVKRLRRSPGKVRGLI